MASSLDHCGSICLAFVALRSDALLFLGLVYDPVSLFSFVLDGLNVDTSKKKRGAVIYPVLCYSGITCMSIESVWVLYVPAR